MTENPDGIDSISRGDVVRLRARPEQTGAVVEVLEGAPEYRYLVYHDGAVATYYASQIELASPIRRRARVPPAALHAALTALQLRHPSISHLYSLFASRIQFVPYQFRPVLKLIQADRPRMLIADEVGVGKTIEAGLILKELQARRDLRSVLIICPKPLVSERKWLEEMKRFDEQFVHLDGGSLRYCIQETHLDGVWPQQYARAILPYSLMDEALLMGRQKGRKRELGLLDLTPPPAFDMVIVDEAHHARNPETWTHRSVRYFCDNAEAVVLLSATPVQLGDQDLFNLLHVLRPDVLSTRRDFEQMAEPNPHLNEAIEAARSARGDWSHRARHAIDQALTTPWGGNVLAADPRLHRVLRFLDEGCDVSDARLSLIRQLEELYTFSSVISRTRRRDIGSFTTRKPETVTVEFTPEQEALHRELLALMARLLARRHGDQNLKFLMSMVRRQMASCVFGLAPFLHAILNRQLTRLEVSELGDDEASEEATTDLDDVRADIDGLVRKAGAAAGPDPKLDAFLEIIRGKQKLPNNKLLVFSTFRHTLAYLVQSLSRQFVRVGLVHGDVPDVERRDFRNRFSLPKTDPDALDVLLSSEVGCEGLDYQFCDSLVNYDLPWNPMRVEQRIGRIDRFGQNSDTVAIYNLVTPGTVDAEIYERCLLRIGVFRQALGGSEEILGRLTREIRDIAENLSLTSQEQATRLQQVADNEIRVVQERARLEEEQASLFGLHLPRRDEDMIEQASSFWLAPSMLANLVDIYLASLEPDKGPRNVGGRPVTNLQISQETRKRLLADFQGSAPGGGASREWERWLRGNEPNVALTFDPETAAGTGERRNRDVMFVTPTHPLIRQAARAAAPSLPSVCNLAVSSSTLRPGRRTYAIYAWRKIGLKDDFTFQPVCSEAEMIPHLLALFRDAKPARKGAAEISSDEEHILDQAHHRLWSAARSGHANEVGRVAESRLASLATSHASRMALLHEQYDSATDPRIRRMRESQLERALRDYEERAEQLRSARERADIIAELVAVGVLIVEEGA